MVDNADYLPPRDVDPILAELEADWLTWLVTLYPEYVTAPFAAHQTLFWNHVWGIAPGVRPLPFVGVWSRGHTKSTGAELACAALAARGIRKYGLYVCRVQGDSSGSGADDHVGNVAALLESDTFGAFYPDHAERSLNKYGAVQGWRRNRLRTAGGFTLDALGLDVAARGMKLEEQRPDFMIFDDLDSETDTALIIEKKVRSLTRKILPAGSTDVAIIAVQNLISNNGIFGQLAGRSEVPADYLVDRVLSGPIPAIEGLQVAHIDGRWKITAGKPTWQGVNLEVCQQQIDTFGLTSFKAEFQHDVDVPPGGMYDHLDWASMRVTREDFEKVAIDRVAVWVDPAVTKHDTSDCHAIQVDALGRDGLLYRLFTWEQRATPMESITLAFRKALEYGSPTIGIETDQGGDTWKSVYREARAELMAEFEDEGDHATAAQLETIRMRSAKAGEGHGSKVHRSAKMLTAYERNRIRHVYGTHDVLEAALRRFPRVKPFDGADVAYWSWLDLAGKVPAKSMSVAGRKMGRRLTAVR